MECFPFPCNNDTDDIKKQVNTFPLDSKVTTLQPKHDIPVFQGFYLEISSVVYKFNTPQH